ncbi:Plasmodium exported protein (Pm-fam-a like), unknown function [Plasmodium malariae]|uniref:Fam-l protein n=1 Tax=Plasmodium malariae TaxID=5858 RepID=A0A1A8WPU9_PLAMA|nr:Plasmodium exported protein (Pm-fam-a like), unknown function [Plasmodium malariae]
MFILLCWITDFDSDTNMFNKILEEEYCFGSKFNTRIYRLLSKCEKSISANVGDLELKIPFNTRKTNAKLFTVENEKWEKEKKEKLYRSLLYKEKLIKRLMKNKCTFLHKSYNHYEKKLMNGLKDNVFFKKMMLINDKDYKKLKRKKYRLRLFFLLLLFIMVLVIPLLDLSFGKFQSTGKLMNELCGLLGYNGQPIASPEPATNGLSDFLSSTCQLKNITGFKVFGILMYCLPILILGIILTRGIFYYYKNVIKHKKIKFLEAFNEW